jgi:Ca-activated chloride channel family protein
MSFGFNNPLAAAAAFIIIPLAAFVLSRLKNPFVASIPLGAPGGVPFKTSQISGLVRLLKILEVTGVFLLFFSAADPVIKTAETVWLNRGADIIFILDVSPSMAALDMNGRNRFSAACTLITEFSAGRPSDNIGLAAVGSDAALLVPPTPDRETLFLRLESLRIGEFGENTALGMGLSTAALHLEKSNAKRKVAVLITDGENNAGSVHPETAAGMLRDMDVSFWVIAVGSAGEVPIDYIDPYTRIRSTGTFDSRYDAESLRRLSVSGGGTYIAAPSSEAFAAAFSQLDNSEITIQIPRIINRRRSFSLFLLITAAAMLTAVRLTRRVFLNKNKLPKELRKKLQASVFFFGVFAAFAIIAAIGPRWGTGFTAAEYRRGLDTIFAIDISRSMDIRDAQTDGGRSRLERGLAIAAESAAAVSPARFGAAIGRGRGYLAVPLTYDNEAALTFLKSLDGSSMTGRSTNLESLIDAAADAFQDSSPARKVIVLVSDGESHAGVIRNALNRCARDGIIVSAVAVGSDEGRPVPDNAQDPLTPAAVSRRDAAVMRTAAERTGGVYIDGSRNDAAANLSSHLLSLAQETGSGSQSGTKQQRALFIMFALIAYGACKAAPLLPRLPFLSMLAVFLIFTSCSRGKLLLIEANYLNSRGRYDEAIVPYLKALNYEDSSPYAEYGLGLTFYSLDERKAALKRYENSQKKLEISRDGEHRELRYRNHYNTGIILFEEGDFHSAAAAFREALRADPGKVEAKRNLELSLMSITMEKNSENREGRQETKEILFDFLQEREQQQWKSREWSAEEKFTGPDY